MREVYIKGACPEGAAAILKDKSEEVRLEFASIACTWTGNAPLAVGMPDKVPLEGSSDSPAGSWPEVMLHVYG
jgi:hypothetical protein